MLCRTYANLLLHIHEAEESGDVARAQELMSIKRTHDAAMRILLSGSAEQVKLARETLTDYSWERTPIGYASQVREAVEG